MNINMKRIDEQENVKDVENIDFLTWLLNKTEKLVTKPEVIKIK